MANRKTAFAQAGLGLAGLVWVAFLLPVTGFLWWLVGNALYGLLAFAAGGLHLFGSEVAARSSGTSPMTEVMDLSVREARPDDAGAIVAILNSIIQVGAFTAFDTPFSIEAERNYIREFPERGVFLVAVRGSDQQVVGFQSMEPFATYTHAFDHVGVLGTYVDLDCRRQGIAKRLFPATFEAALRKGYHKIFTFIRADNSAALSTYRHHGFGVVGIARAHAKLNGRYVDEIIVEKMLDDAVVNRQAV